MSASDPTASFLRAIQRSGLLEYEQYTELGRWATESQADVQGVAKEVFRRRWLTQYQIKEIFKGRGQSLVLGPYALLDLLGEGGMGKVFKAHHLRLGRDVALKIIRKEKLTNPAAEARFRSEIQAVAQMSHPHVVLAYDADQVGDTHFYVMEFIDGTDLAQIVKARGPLPMNEACEYVRQAAQGLQHAFEMGLVHRDIKPSNLLVTRDGRQVKILDFGLALLGEPVLTPEMNRITREGFVLGTPDFLAPEQARNPSGVDIRADIYALGGTLYYLLTGKPPFEAKSPQEKLVKHCSEPPPDVRWLRREVPPHLAALIQWYLAKRPEDRPQTPADMAHSLLPYGLPHSPGTSGAYVPQPAPQMPPQYPAAQPIAVQPLEAYAFPQAVQAYAENPFTTSASPMPAVDPEPSSQIFKLTTDPVDDPIRQRAESRKSLVTPLLFLFGGLILAGIAGFAVFRVLRPEPPPPLRREFTNDLGMKFVLLDGGTFAMGSAENEPGRLPDEGPVREITLREKFYIATTEVTQSQYVEVMGTSPTVSGRAESPVEKVAWEDAVEFCKRMTKSKKFVIREGWAYRLPTEAEWEYACRAGSRTHFAFGERLHFPLQAQFTKGPDDIDLLATLDENAELKMPTLPDLVARRKERANAWGLYDMHGNVGEWVSDWYSREYETTGSMENPQGPVSGGKRVIRGGSWKEPAIACRSAARRAENPVSKLNDVGFRVVYAPVNR